MRLQLTTIFTQLVFPLFLAAQVQLEPGFALLEQGQFGQAEHFFAAALDEAPDNRTARICYGRAVGLNGNPDKALSIFSDLRAESPEDTEVLLNVAEAYMWAKEFSKAEKLYDRLLRQAPDNFTANLGAANARASQKNYPDALPLIDRALELQAGNANALVSKKFILLGIASAEKNKWNYDAAHLRLDQVESIFPGDVNARLLRADVYLSDQKIRPAQQVYQSLIADSVELVPAYKGLSYTQVLLGKKKAALGLARSAVAAAEASVADTLQRINTGIQLANALGVNRRFSEAFRTLDTLEADWGNDLSIDLARARMKIWNKDLREGADLYQGLLLKNPRSFDLLMGLVDARRAKNDPAGALSYLQQARRLLPTQPDAFRLWKELAQADMPAIQLNGSLLQDSGGNIGQGLSLRFELGRKGNLHPYVMGSHWQAQQLESGVLAHQKTFMAGTQIRFTGNIKARISGGATIYSDFDQQQQLAPRLETGLNFVLGKYHNFDAAISRDLHNYTADLVQSGISRDHLTFTYNFAAPTRLGLYSQYIHTRQSDGNQRDLIFASLYFKLLETPVVKLGVNYNTFGFERQESEKYFSPLNANATEAFIQIMSDRSSRKKCFYEAFFASGVQRVASGTPQHTTRLELGLGLRLASTFEMILKYQKGNTVQNSISGYAYDQVSVQVRYEFPVAHENPFREWLLEF